MTSTSPQTRRRVTAPHRRLRLAGALAAVGVRSALPRRDAGRRRGRAQVCGAARVLTALGVRVAVVLPTVPWPRTGGRLVVQGSPGRIGELAVLTAVPRSVDGWGRLAERALLGRPAPAEPDDRGGVLLPVAVRCRPADTDAWLEGAALPRQFGPALAWGGLVVEVRLLPPVVTSGAAH